MIWQLMEKKILIKIILIKIDLTLGLRKKKFTIRIMIELIISSIDSFSICILQFGSIVYFHSIILLIIYYYLN